MLGILNRLCEGITLAFGNLSLDFYEHILDIINTYIRESSLLKIFGTS
jgi:hypothetical protein